MITKANGVGSPAAACAVLLLLLVAQDALADVAAVRFDSRFLIGEAQSMDVSRFERGNPVSPGDYSVDLYVNHGWQGRQRLLFRELPESQQVQPCFSLAELSRLGVDVMAQPQRDEALCLPLNGWIEDAELRFDQANLRLDISIPQAYMQRQARGFVSPELWDRGINGAFISYNLSGNHIDHRQSGINDGETTSGFLGLSTGVNLGGWQLRHNSNFSRRSSAGQNWQKTSTYFRRAFPDSREVLTIGDHFTGGDIFDSVGYRGANLSSEERMLPDSLRGYAPVVRGVAETNAEVEVRQNGNLLYRTTVSPGPFVIDDLYPTGFGGDLDVTITESDGRQTRFSQPYASVAQLLRPGIARWSLTGGELRYGLLDEPPVFYQGTYQRGLNNLITGYTGVTGSSGYFAYLAGLGFATPFGALAVDVTRSQARFDNQADRSGNSIRLNYAKRFDETNTNLALAAYRYSTQGFLNLQDAALAQQYDSQGLPESLFRRQRSQFQVTVNQALAGRRGALYLTGSVRDFWDESGSVTQYQLGYNNRYRLLNYGVSTVQTEDQRGDTDRQWHLTFSLPLGGPQSVSVNGGVSLRDDDYDSSRLGVRASGGEYGEYNYGVTVSDSRHGQGYASMDGQYRSRYSTLSSTYSHSSDFRQLSAGVSGTFLAHEGGITMTPYRGDTLVLVEAPGATGARIASAQGVEIDDFGYAVLPYVTPYRMNRITLDPRGIADDVELQGNSVQLAPYAGAIGRVVFETRQGQAVLIRARQQDGRPLPFAAQVYDQTGANQGMVGQGGIIYLRTDQSQGQLQVRWGEGVNQQCQLGYQAEFGTVAIQEAVCR